MVARAMIAAASCVLASIVDAHSSTTSQRSASADSIPVSSEYSLLFTGKECGGHRLNTDDALVGSWGECQSKCDDLGDKCQYFSVYSKYLTGKNKNKFQCQLHTTCVEAQVIAEDPFSAVFQKQQLEYGVDYPDRIVRHHNIMRCMHDAPPLQWTVPASKEAQNYAHTASGHAGHGQHIRPETEWNPMPGGFDELEQRVAYQTGAGIDCGAPGSWCDNTVPIEDWYNNDDLRGPLLWPSTAYIGCGGTHSNPSGSGATYDIWRVCNYGPEKRTDPSKHLDKTVRPRNKKTAKECAFSIDSQNRFDDVLRAQTTSPNTAKRVTIAYTPKPRTGLSQQAGDCGEISEYRLVFDAKTDKVQLVGVDPETMNKPDTPPTPCKDSGFTEFHTWGYDTDAYFTDVKGTKQCLNVQGFSVDPKVEGTLAVDSGENNCGRNNYFGQDPRVIDINGAWHFTQDYFPHMCMMDVEEGAGVKSVLDNLPAGNLDDETNPAHCSGQWTVRAFGDDFDPPAPPTPPSQLNFLEASKDTDYCHVCRSEVGNFACAHPKHCSLAPTEFACNQTGGEWCGPRGWKVHGDCAPDSYQCQGAVDPHHADQAGCVQLGGVYKTQFADCAHLADGVYTENDCQNGLKNNNGYEDRDVSDCVNLVKQTHDKTANVFDFVAGYKYDVPQHAPYCRLWHCSGLKENTLPKQDGDQAWLIAYKTKNTLSRNFASIMV